MYLYGASGHAKVIIDILEASGEKIDGLVDDNPEVVQLQGYPVSHESKYLSPFIVSIGVNAIRKKIVEKLDGVRFGKAIHPSAVVSPSASIDEGTVVMQGAMIMSVSSVNMRISLLIPHFAEMCRLEKVPGLVLGQL